MKSGAPTSVEIHEREALTWVLRYWGKKGPFSTFRFAPRLNGHQPQIATEPPLGRVQRPGNGAPAVQDRARARWRLGGCSWCGGSCYWDPDRFVDGEAPGAWTCLACGRTA